MAVLPSIIDFFRYFSHRRNSSFLYLGHPKKLPWEIFVKERLNDTVKTYYDVVLAKQIKRLILMWAANSEMLLL